VVTVSPEKVRIAELIVLLVSQVFRSSWCRWSSDKVLWGQRDNQDFQSSSNDYSTADDNLQTINFDQLFWVALE